MRIWCVPSAAELESPKLPPRIDRDVFLRSPPPPPRLSKEEKAARGVLPVHRRRRDHHKNRKTRKHRKVSSSSSSGNASPTGNPSLANSTPRSSPGTSSGFSSGFSGSGSIIGTGPRHFRSPSDSCGGVSHDRPPRDHHQNYSFDGSDPRPHSRRNPRSKSASRFNLSESRNFRSTQNFVDVERDSSRHFSRRKNASNDDFFMSNGNSEPSLILHPGTSKSRERKAKKSSKKKGRRLLLVPSDRKTASCAIFAISFYI